MSIRSVPDGIEVQMLADAGSVRTVSFSPDGRRLATLTSADMSGVLIAGEPRDAEIRVWDLDSGAQAGSVWRGHFASRMRFSPDGQRLVAFRRVCTWRAKPMEMDSPQPRHERAKRETWVELTEVLDVPSGGRLVVHAGSRYGDPQPFAAGSYRYQSVCREPDVILEEIGTGNAVAPLAVPSAQDIHHSASPDGRTWAWSFGPYIFLAALEGGPPESANRAFAPRVPCIARYKIYRHMEPPPQGRKVYHEFIRLDDHRTAIVLGWVAGAPQDAAARVTRLGREVRAAFRGYADPGSVLADLNRGSQWLGQDQFATLLLLVLDGVRNHLLIASAGHAGPWKCRPDGTVTELVGKDTLGLPLNVLEDFAYDVIKVELSPGAMIFAASDVFLDTASPAGERFAPGWFEDAVRRGATSPYALGRAIVNRLHRLTNLDPERFELTVLCVGRSRSA